jgi:NADPH:quinone reductase
MNIAVDAGVHVIATVRSKNSIAKILELGAQHVFLEAEFVSKLVRQHVGHVDSVLDIVGTSTVLDSLQMAKRGGAVCLVGFLGGGEPVLSINPMIHLPSARSLSFFASALVFGTSDFPLSDIPFQSIVDKVAHGHYRATPARTFAFNDIVAAHELLDSQSAGGKIVVTGVR